ncbi:hypothetical protein KDE13_03835 [Campylobacter sp. faydin G-140]|uniref:hypothetical protein n=1 Tax=Campylobacter anatolicus TaxID=2829105 RepID=UPI001B9273BC|nr:hypothetical protein [Campylobacter anatolicus]MBR8465491.1 hypothetical protein [Campylobacter anatolicus]
MKKFLVILTLLSAYVQSYGYDACNYPEIKKFIEEMNSKSPVKVDDYTTGIGISCVNNAIEFIYVTSDELFKKIEKLDKPKVKRAMCSFPETKVWLSKVGTGKMISTYINKSLTERFQFSVTKKDCNF